jgi:translation initiation factor IF-3
LPPVLFLSGNYRRCAAISKENLRINDEIRARDVRVVTANNEQLGVMPLREALRIAAEGQMDLVEVAPLAKPPVCRIMDYGKFKYEQQKREKEAKKKQKVVTVKEVKVRPNIEDHDYNVKLKNALRFLQDGDKVKATVMFRGRELSHPELGRQVLVRMAAELKEIANVEREPKLEGKNMIMILAAKPQH